MADFVSLGIRKGDTGQVDGLKEMTAHSQEIGWHLSLRKNKIDHFHIFGKGYTNKTRCFSEVKLYYLWAEPGKLFPVSVLF